MNMHFVRSTCVHVVHMVLTTPVIHDVFYREQPPGASMTTPLHHHVTSAVTLTTEFRVSPAVGSSHLKMGHAYIFVIWVILHALHWHVCRHIIQW